MHSKRTRKSENAVTDSEETIGVIVDLVLNEHGIAVNTTDRMVLGIMLPFRWFKNLQRPNTRYP